MFVLYYLGAAEMSENLQTEATEKALVGILENKHALWWLIRVLQILQLLLPSHPQHVISLHMSDWYPVNVLM